MAFENLIWKKYHPLSDQNGFICLVNHMGDDSSIVQAARASYDGFSQGLKISKKAINKVNKEENNQLLSSDIVALDTRPDQFGYPDVFRVYFREYPEDPISKYFNDPIYQSLVRLRKTQIQEDRHLIRYLMNHSHTTPFEMVEFTFMVQVPMDCWRQWIRHRTASVNEYSTRYTEALDFFQVTRSDEWRLQATDNKQGSSGFLPAYTNEAENEHHAEVKGGDYFTDDEQLLHEYARMIYHRRLEAGIAKEQARKDLPLSTYTRAYWKCDLHNIFNFLRLRMDSHAQLEIRSYANCMFEIVKQVCPVACEAFEDYVLHAKKFSRMEMEILREVIGNVEGIKPSSMTDREWKEFLGKLS